MNVRLSAALASVAAMAIVGVAAALGSPGSRAEAVDAGIVGAAAAPSWQTNNVVYAIAYRAGVVYLGGTFTSVRPPGAAPGVGEVARAGLAAFNSTTGDLLPWAPSIAGTAPNVETLAVSQDGSTVYIGGTFTSVNGVARSDVAAVSASSGALTAYAPRIPTGTVYAITPVANGTVYIGGKFGVISGIRRTNAGATDAAGSVLPWAPVVSGGALRAISLAPDGSLTVLGGSFSTVDGVAHRGVMAVDPSVGGLVAAWGAGPQLESTQFQVYHEAGDATHVYINGVDNGGGTEFDGTAALRWADGGPDWVDYCYGDTHAITVLNGVLYAGGHGHNCSRVLNGYPDLPFHQGMYAEATSNGTMLAWFPKSNSSSSSEQTGTRVMATDGLQVFAGGDFTKINEKPQQGFARFPASPGVSPLPPKTPSATGNADHTATVTVNATYDRDDGALSYSLYRDGTTLVATTSAPVVSRFWYLPPVTLTDPTPPAGVHFYTVRASDGHFSPKSPSSNLVFVP